MPDQLEIEVKFIVDDHIALLHRLQSLQLSSKGPYFESNIWLDDTRCSLRSRRIVLRVRSIEENDPACIVTVKTPVDHADERFRVQREIEFTASDRRAAIAAFEVLGYTPIWQYDKYRTMYTCKNKCEICLDELPIGWFIELEGEREDILVVATQLGFNMERAITLNYAEIYKRLRDQNGFKYQNLTFDNFNGFSVDPAVYYDLLF